MRFALLLALVCAVEPAERLTSRIVFLVDVSGSMKGPKIDRAIDAVVGPEGIARQAGDQLEIAVVSFASEVQRWPGVPEEGVPADWAGLPSDDALVAARGWLEGQGSDGCSTDLCPALRLALAEERDELSLVIVTDGVLSDADAVLGVLREGQAARVARGLKPAVVAVWGVDGDEPILREIGQAGRGGFFHEEGAAPAPPVWGASAR